MAISVLMTNGEIYNNNTYFNPLRGKGGYERCIQFSRGWNG